MDRNEIRSMYGIKDDALLDRTLKTYHEIDVPRLLSMAADGSNAIVEMAKGLVDDVMATHGADAELVYPETGYGLPAIFAWKGIENLTLEKAKEFLDSLPTAGESSVEDGMVAGENAMYAADIIEAIAYLNGKGNGFIPDRVLRALGLPLVDDTIPGAVVFLGGHVSGEDVSAMIRSVQGKGMVAIASGDYPALIQRQGIEMGLDRMMYPVGMFTGTVHALNFAVRAALTFGNVAGGDAERLSDYLKKRPKVFVIQTGPLCALDAAFAFAALKHSACIVTDQNLPEIPGAVKVCKDHLSSIQTGIEERGIVINVEPIELPVPYGPSFEGELIRKPDTYVEAGGTRSTAFEVLLSKDEDSIEDGSIKMIGKEIDDFEAGSIIPLAMIVEVYGKDMHDDLEPVIERRFHSSINFAQGVWHAGQRDSDWVRISNKAKEAGFKLADLGKILVHKVKEEFGGIATRVQATIITDESEIQRRMPEAKEAYDRRDERMKGLKDDLVDDFYTCTMCQSFAPAHICIVSPERIGLCGAINWLDAKAGHEISPNGPNQPLKKEDAIDIDKGEFRGINDMISSASHGDIERICMYSLMDAPMTSCGCFEVIAAMTVDMQAVVLVDRDFPGMTPVGMKFSTLAGSIGGGRQTPGFMGIGRKYITSEKFISAEGGIARIAWMPKHLKDLIKEQFQRRCEDIGMPDLWNKIADETITDDAEGLMAWMAQVEHPALTMDPLL
ncbi:acetyl-CoA decarbonylase/synthase complex subunit alpha/beta [Candidatus Methanarcanum hacksteinii]|uniref:acetyl-CoA decarbonylase/synthase complex subunit alpha/beta n=1 Tax=Candidatus Methanarcanum hacksteinii TaxID=2911857 RepID=UPI0037DBF328